ncbi:tripartite tricarboxylate transporter substrate binding protein [Evansella sp. AB-P1]|uniref:tripartite tricarboxylate transporter substrate binding protein n=1 Tax=Evansella sp. AB-P1 TaxID=3037653 RepID=UPI00241D2E32|nr:tripartite tricarboxylate transporter substrate binding protein [Evansella sp. AB-P1]MDG5788055.1 tripartite tricarboxylate transporter substrate binding protein [Evansella sp. AB-P1]
MNNNRLFLLLLTVVGSLFILVGCGDGAEDTGAEGADYPKQAIEIYVPASPGGATDASARIIAKHINEYLGEDFIIINESGGGGTLAFETVRNDDTNGYKLLYFHQALHTGYATNRYEYPATDLTAIGTYSAVNQAYVVSADSPWDSLDDFVEDAKSNPGEYSFGAQLSGTTHFMGAMLAQEAGIEYDILDFGAESDRMAALLGGQIDMIVTSVGNAIEYVESGDFKVLAVLNEERDPAAPDFPTAVEQGYDIVFSITHALFGPSDLPENVIAALNEATAELAEDEAYIEALGNLGHVHVLNDSEATTDLIEREFNIIQDLGKELGF